jgi:hypothetical protein
MAKPNPQPSPQSEAIEEYQRAHRSNRPAYRLKDFRRNVLIALANSAPEFWTSRLRNPLFIIGCARSGTTMLERLLARHRDVADWSEANMLWDPVGYYWSMSRRETPPLWVDPYAFIGRWRKENALRGVEIRAAFGMFQTVTGKAFLLNKNPQNLFRIPDVLALFPEARFVHIVRDGRAVVNSNLSRMTRKLTKWPEFYHFAGIDYSREELALRMSAFWRVAMLEVEAQDAGLNLKKQGRLIEIQYETLCDDRAGTLRAVCDLTGLDADRFRPGVWNMEVDSRNFKWKQNFEPELLSKMEAAMRPKLAEWGYV